MALDFIFMLTRDDRTVADAPRLLDIALAEGVRHIGFKDVGVPTGVLRGLTEAIRAAGGRSVLEVVSLDRDSELASARAGLALGVDTLMGGTHAGDVLALLAGSGPAYCPFPGRVEGHPSVLTGSIASVVDSARALAAHPGVDGLDLLAYRSAEDGGTLMHAVCAAVDKPVIVAGSIDTPARIRSVRDAGAWGFTVGTAALDGTFPAEVPGLAGQLRAIRAVVDALE